MTAVTVNLGHGMSTESLTELDQRIRQLRQQTQGLQGAVLEKSDPQRFAEVTAELEAAMHEHYLLLYGNSVLMP